MGRAAAKFLAPGRAGALGALFGWLAVYLQLAIANLLGFSPLCALWFGLGGGVLAAALGALLGLGLATVLRGLAGAVAAALVPFALAAALLIQGWWAATSAGRGELLLGPTVQALALAFVGGAVCTGMVRATGRGTRSGALAAVLTLAAGGFLARNPAPVRAWADRDRLTVELRSAFEPPATLVLALDGLDGQALDALLAAERRSTPGAARLPVLQELVDSGSRADLETVSPANPVHVWTTLATGRPWFEHGVRDWDTWWLLGAARSCVVEGTLAAPVLRLLAFLPFLAQRQVVVNAAFRERRAFWEVLGQAGLTTAVIGWPLTHPAPRAPGTLVVSELAFASGSLPEEEVQPEDWRGVVASMRLPGQVEEFRGEARAVLKGIRIPDEARRQRVEDALVRFQQRMAVLEEMLSRNAADTYVLHDRIVATVLAAQAGLSDDEGRELTARMFAVADAVLQRLLTRLRFSSGAAQVFLISGSGRGEVRGGAKGVFLASGALVARRADLGRVSVFDFVPTLMAAKGLPVAADLAGRVLDPLFARKFREEHPVRRTITYEYPGWRDSMPARLRDEEAEKAVLDELGCATGPMAPPGS